jgi:DNA-binding transcriptional regulator WhiA
MPEPDELTNPLSDFWTTGLRHLPPQLKEAAYLRLYKPEASLTEIGESLTPPVGKAAISKRFAKLRALAENVNGDSSH